MGITGSIRACDCLPTLLAHTILGPFAALLPHWIEPHAKRVNTMDTAPGAKA